MELIFRKISNPDVLFSDMRLFPLPQGERDGVKGNQVECDKFSRVYINRSTISGYHLIHKTGLFKFSLFILALFLLSCAEKPVFREEVFYPRIKQPAVVVKLVETKDLLTISSDKQFAIRCFPPEGEPSIYYALGEIELKLSDESIILSHKTQGKLETYLCKVSFLPQKNNSWIFLNGKPYRGAIEITLSKNSDSLVALNIVNLEDYLKGVVPAEMGKLNHPEMEALKAQAIAARTYSLSRIGRYPDRGYDLEATVVDQIYSGVEGEDPLANKAIWATGGKVLIYEGKLIHAYYHANCGGKTEYIERVWDKPKQPYLISIDDDGFCSWSKNYQWEESWTKDLLRKNIKEFIGSLPISPDKKPGNADASFDLLDLKIKERSPSGRVETLQVVTDRGTFSICADKIRWALKRASNPNSILPSTWFDLEIERGINDSIQRVRAFGRGNGHGVGMCQTGAIGMAKAGYSHKDILMHYYPGVKITKCY
jgi:stage II sporulation protein D